jgi:hypothetical protein
MTTDPLAALGAPATRYFRRKEASEYLWTKFGLSYTQKTLGKLAVLGGGPRYHLAGRFPIYPAAELDEWAMQKLGALVSSTAEAKRGVAGG